MCIRDRLEDVLEWCLELGIKELTVFALSTDNLKRSAVEVETLIKLIRDSFAKMAENGGFMEKAGVKVRVMGDTTLLPKDAEHALQRSEELTIFHSKLSLNVCVCYNSKHEIIGAF